MLAEYVSRQCNDPLNERLTLNERDYLQLYLSKC